MKDDVLLICTDGLTNMLDTDEIYNIVTENKNDVKKGCELLIANANEQGGYDNISVILISYID